MPEPTLRAVADHGDLRGDTLSGQAEASQQVFDDLAALGVDMDAVFEQLETEGVDKFKVAWEELLATVDAALAADGAADETGRVQEPESAAQPGRPPTAARGGSVRFGHIRCYR